MAVNESLVLDGLELNELAQTTYVLEGLRMPTPAKRLEWGENADQDGALLVRDPSFENRTIEADVRIMAASRDLLHDAIGAVVAKLEEAERNLGGIALVWTPANGTEPMTFYVLTGALTEVPVTIEAGYFVNKPLYTINLTCKPYGYTPERGVLTDDFTTDSISAGLWAFDTGTSVVWSSGGGGRLQGNVTTESRLYRTDREFYAAQITTKLTTGATATPTLQIILKRLDATNYLRVGITAGANLRIAKVVAGAATDLQQPAYALSPSTAYWIRARIEGNKITAQVFTSAPTPTSTPAAEAIYTLSGAEATQFGQGIKGDVGLRVIPAVTGGTENYDDFTVEPQVWRGSTPLVEAVIYGVEGDVPAEGRLIVTDTSSQSKDFLAFGLEQRYYNSATLLRLDTTALTVTGFAGTSTTRAGSNSTNVFRGTLTPTTPLAICGTGNQSHIGVFRVYARVYASAADTMFRFSWREGDGPLRANSYAEAPAAAAWCEVDLGLVSIPEKTLGTQRWNGQIEAYSVAGGDTLDTDYLTLVPVEIFGKARHTLKLDTPTTFSARDEFDQTAGVLTGKTAPIGGVWAGAGDADDFSIETAGKTAQRTALTDVDINTGRYAASGVAAFAAQVVSVDVKADLAGRTTTAQAVLARYTDTSNWLMAGFQYDLNRLAVVKRVAGTRTVIWQTPFSQDAGAWYTHRVLIDANGRWFFWSGPRGVVTPIASGQDAVLATGGALATGKPGFYDYISSGNPATRNYDNFAAWVPVDDAVMFSTQSIELRHDGVLREDSTGTYWGNPPSYRGAPFLLPPAGDESRASRVAVMTRRSDIEELPEANVTDGTQLEVRYRARYINVSH